MTEDAPMITERRLISFSRSALADGVMNYGMAAKPPRFTLVRSIDVTGDHTPTLVAEVAGGEDDPGDLIEFNPAETVAILILLCRRERIPLPRHSEKTLCLDNGELCLVLTRRLTSSGSDATA